jgi:hypothetical protein
MLDAPTATSSEANPALYSPQPLNPPSLPVVSPETSELASPPTVVHELDHEPAPLPSKIYRSRNPYVKMNGALFVSYLIIKCHSATWLDLEDLIDKVLFVAVTTAGVSNPPV